MLNASPQVEKPIRFVYAIRDSIFDRFGLEAEGRRLEPHATGGPAEAEAVRANRTKFFDLVVPVVPFITHRSARNLAAQLLGEIEHEVNPELLDLAAQFVPDMRLLKNVRNEFIVFRDRVFSGDGARLGLNETDLFAMMLYKSTHLTDFEKIRLGTSNLDLLYKVGRDLVAESIKRLEGEQRVLRQQLVRKNGAESRSERLGGLLITHVERTAVSAAALGRRRRNGLVFSVDGTLKSDADLRGVDFWAAFVAADGDPELSQEMSSGHQLTFSRSSLVGALGDPLDAGSWSKADLEALTAEITGKAEDITFLRGADLCNLVGRPEFLVTYEEAAQSFELIAKALLTSGLAYRLVRAGWVNRNFTLYSSTFHGDRVSSAATNFIIHHIERDLMDEYFELGPEDVDAIIRERGKNALKESALYNIAIIDRLLETDVDAADVMIRSCATLGERQARFVQAYISAGEQRQRFIERFTAVSSHVVEYLVNQAELDDALRLCLVDVALAHLSSAGQRADAAVIDYLARHYAEFVTLTSEKITPTQAERVAEVFDKGSISVPNLDLLGRQVRSSFVSRSLYEITTDNLALAVGSDESVALDVVRGANATVYRYVLEHMDTYLDAIEGRSATVDANDQFIAVIEDVLEHGEDHLDDILERADPECRIEDLTAVPEGAWQALAAHRRFRATFGNVSGYVRAQGAIDLQLAGLLTTAGAITEVHSAAEEPKVALAVEILAARNLLPSPELRADLVASLDLPNHLDAGAFAIESGELFALLLRRNVIADDVESYERLTETDWPTRRAFIRASSKFAGYMTPDLVRPDLAALLMDDEIDAAVKYAVVTEARAYAEGANARGLDSLARFATQYECEVPPDVVLKVAQGGVPAPQVILLLEPHLRTITRDQLFAILSELGGAYANLTAVGYDKPKVPNTAADRALLERLKKEGIVNSYDDQRSPIRVNKRYK